MTPADRVYVAGHRGLVGSALVRELGVRGYREPVTATRAALDLRDPAATAAFVAACRPDCILMAAARVGGIGANSSQPADFILDNLEIQTSLIRAAVATGVRQVLFLGSSCIYPGECPQPIREEYLLTGPLEATNRPYAVAKLAGIEACLARNRQHPGGPRFVCAMPANLYGPGDNYDPASSHVLAALVRRFVEARRWGLQEVTLWGTGQALREFLHVADVARACVDLMEVDHGFDLVNVGSGEEIRIADLAGLVAEAAGYRGRTVWDRARPDGTPRKLLDSSRIRSLGWSPTWALRQGVAEACSLFGEAHGVIC